MKTMMKMLAAVLAMTMLFTSTAAFADNANNEEAVQTVESPAPEAPKTEEPKAEAPKTEAPKTEAPKTEAPKTEEPKTEEPKTEEPKTEAPKTETPATETPATETPATETPATETPATETPETETPATETPETETPATDPTETETETPETDPTETPTTDPTETPETPETDPTENPDDILPGMDFIEGELNKDGELLEDLVESDITFEELIAERSVLLVSDRDLNNLTEGDVVTLSLVLTGFEGVQYTIDWQTCKDGEWTNIKDEHGLTYTFTVDADCIGRSWRAYVEVI